MEQWAKVPLIMRLIIVAGLMLAALVVIDLIQK